MRPSSARMTHSLALAATMALAPGSAAAATIGYAADIFTGVDYVRMNFVDPMNY